MDEDQHFATARHLLHMEGLARSATTTSVVARAVTGDREAFARIVATHHVDMVRVAYVVAGGDQATADDAVQSAWVVAWRKLGSLRDPSRLKHWLIAIAANEARQLCRRQRRASTMQVAVAWTDPDAPAPRGADPGERADWLDLEDALRGLTADERTLLALRHEAGLDSREIGRILGHPAATVRWRLARLTSKLRRELHDG